MRQEAAAIRPMTKAESLNPGSKTCVTCRKVAPKYIARWIYTKYSTRAYRFAGGHNGKIQMRDYLCKECAQQWCEDNNLAMHEAPIDDPAPGQRWRKIDAPHEVVTITSTKMVDHYMAVEFEPPVSFNTLVFFGIAVLPIHTFLGDFDPVLGEVET